MNQFLVIGCSSGIGRILVKKLIDKGENVWGIARRKKLLISLQSELNNSKFKYLAFNITSKGFWPKLITKMRDNHFIPDIVVFNAAINPNDLTSNINMKITNQIFRTNFLTIMEGINFLFPYLSKHSQYIAISSSSAFKGSAFEGVGYPASKAALSIAFESLYQKYKSTGRVFTTIYFGPINTRMRKFKYKIPLTLDADKAVECILLAMKERKAFYYCPAISFGLLKLLKAVLSNEIILEIFAKINNKYNAK